MTLIEKRLIFLVSVFYKNENKLQKYAISIESRALSSDILKSRYMEPEAQLLLRRMMSLPNDGTAIIVDTIPIDGVMIYEDQAGYGLFRDDMEW